MYLASMGKKPAPGLNNDWGDQGLFGHEEGESLADLRGRLEHDLQLVEEVRKQWKDSSIETDDKTELLKSVIKVISERIKYLRVLFQKQQLALKKILKEEGTDWKNSKYVYAISSVQAQMFQIRNVVKKLLDGNNVLLFLGSSINGRSDVYRESAAIDIFSQRNIITLRVVENIRQNYLLRKSVSSNKGHPNGLKLENNLD